MSQNAWNKLCDEIEQAWQNGDYDYARQKLQEIAYSMVGSEVTQEQKNQFTEVMKDFAKVDPLYREIMALALPFIEANPGTMQSKIYDQLTLQPGRSALRPVFCQRIRAYPAR
jgi:hypothetical protein